MLHRRLLLSLGLLTLCLVGVLVYWQVAVPVRSCAASGEIPTTLRLSGATFALRVADTPELRMQGLSSTTRLPAGNAMLFVFPDDAIREFWMKDMRYPLDIIWIDRDLRVLGTTKDARPESYPDMFSSPAPARYVLEVNGGVVAQLSVATGTRILLMGCMVR